MKLGGQFDFKTVNTILSKKEEILIDKTTLKKLEAQRQNITRFIEQGKIMYGINTGFGALRTKNISANDLAALQENIILSHAVGVGNPIPQHIVKTIMFLIVNYLSKGFSGVRPIIIQTLTEMINKGVIPIVPEKGSVGSSGDLAPSAHIMLVLLGRGEAYYKDERIGGQKAMEKAGIKPVQLDAKEGLALINNTATMTAYAIDCLIRAERLKKIADIACALSAEALRATPNAFDPRIHAIKPHKGQIAVAKQIKELLKNSTMVDTTRVQDQYSIRCAPQVHGAIRDAIDYVTSVVNTEINAVTDNPLIFGEGKLTQVVSGGNFHGEPVAIAMDTLRLAMCGYANISDRRISSLLDPNHNFGLPAFLVKNPGLHSGMMIIQYTTAALVSENKILAHPAVVDSVPTSANIEDYVSMGTIAARKTYEVLANVQHVLAIELLVACQAIDFRLQEGYTLGTLTNKIYKKIRKQVPFFSVDQEYMQHVQKIEHMIEEDILIA